MQDAQKKTVCAFHGHFRIQRKTSTKLTANGEESEKLKTKVRQEKAYGECIGVQRRRRTWQAAKSHGERQAG